MAKIKLEELKYVGPIPEEIVEEIAEPAETIEAAQGESLAEEDLKDLTEAEEAVEPKKVEEEIGVVTKPVAAKIEKEIKFVKNIRVKTKPSDNIPAKSYTGNVEITGHIGEFTIIRYVKAGFGSITGYTKDC